MRGADRERERESEREMESLNNKPRRTKFANTGKELNLSREGMNMALNDLFTLHGVAPQLREQGFDRAWAVHDSGLCLRGGRGRERERERERIGERL